jgi:hypothetical protein
MQDEPTCANCGIVIRWQPTRVGASIYCCSGCAEGGPCRCDYDNLPGDREIRALVRQEVRGLLDSCAGSG